MEPEVRYPDWLLAALRTRGLSMADMTSCRAEFWGDGKQEWRLTFKSGETATFLSAAPDFVL